ncbi:MAG: type IX secretion system membrane protein PorP/SprF [Cytophagaceae bacterium]|nr:type IX secretion system membrane protein PorP/SprF [Cytophagaceae bacterium]
MNYLCVSVFSSTFAGDAAIKEFSVMYKRAGFILLFIGINLMAQDPQFSQYYNNPLYLNPAFTGTGEDTRLGLNYRSQWPGLDPAFTISNIWSDFFFPKHNTSLGFIMRRDLNSNTKLRSMELGVSSAYSIMLTKGWAIRPGLMLSYNQRDLNFANAILGDALDDDGNIGSSADPILQSKEQYGYLDVSAGLLTYSSRAWLGFSAYHLNTPDQSITQNTSSPLPTRFSLQGGYKFILEERYIAFGAPMRETSLTPTFHYLSQGEFDQLDAGLYYRWDPVMAGLWYRGIPIRQYRLGYSNTEGIILMGGVRYQGLSFFYSYDINIGQLRTIASGSHEICVQYSTLLHKKIKKRKTGFSIPCPNLDKRFKKNRIG